MSTHVQQSTTADIYRRRKINASSTPPAALFGMLVLMILATILVWNSRPNQSETPALANHGQLTTATQPTETAAEKAAPFVTRDPEGRLQWPRPRTNERRAERERMVRRTIANDALFRDAVEDERVLAAMRTVPRHEFVPASRRRFAYNDSPLPIGEGQTISQPYIVALMSKLLEVEPGDRVLEIGTGSGYQAAVLNELTPYVFTIENVKPLAERAAADFQRLGYKTIVSKFGDGYEGWPAHAPFDGVIVTCAAERVPTPLWEQLKPGGRMVIPVGGEYRVQQLIVLTKRPDGSRERRSIIPVRFVPMTGKVREP